MGAVPELRRDTRILEGRRFSKVAGRLRYPLTVYLISRVLYLLIAILDIFLRNWPLAKSLRNWDGKWYVLLAQHGYPHTIPVRYDDWSTLGFEPLYSMLAWLGGVILPGGVELPGVLLSIVLGGVATVEMSALAQRWWGRAASRRGVLFFCFFPGTIVFSMTYSEGLALALVAGCVLCLEDRRWILAGVLAGLATAVEPVCLAIIPACAAVSLRELWRSGRGDANGVRAILAGLRDPEARRSLWAPILSPAGAIGFAIFLWGWVGSPLANYRAQRIAWGEHSSVLAVFIQIRTFVNEFLQHHALEHLNRINLNLPAGFLGACFMIWAIWQMWKYRRGLLSAAGAGASQIGTGPSLAAWVWTGFVALLTFTSDKTPPNPRMLICAFPLLFAVAAPRTGRSQKILLGISLILLVAMSIGTFADGSLRP